ncbi:MAG: rod shape-determining protein MreC [bacterium]|nr:rod shape-determining protein MreC [bacterium]
MLWQRRIGENRPTIILAVLVLLSVVSLAFGTSGSVVRDGIHTVILMAAHPFYKAFDAVGGGVGYVGGLLVAYDSAIDQAADLQEALDGQVPLLAQRDELLAENDRLREVIQFERSNPKLTLIHAEVISHSGGMLIIDRGSRHGVKMFMCAMTKDGVVGVVTRVEPTLSQVATLNSADCKIGAMIRRNRVAGMVHGSGSTVSHLCAMRYIDLKDEVVEGDEVVTSGGTIYPAGYVIGRIAGPPREENALQRMAFVEPAADPYRLDEVALVMKAQTPGEELAGTPARIRETVSMAHTMPDKRPIQERYAP